MHPKRRRLKKWLNFVNSREFQKYRLFIPMNYNTTAYFVVTKWYCGHEMTLSAWTNSHDTLTWRWAVPCRGCLVWMHSHAFWAHVSAMPTSCHPWFDRNQGVSNRNICSITVQSVAWWTFNNHGGEVVVLYPYMGMAWLDTARLSGRCICSFLGSS